MALPAQKGNNPLYLSIISGCKDGTANKFHLKSQHWLIISGCFWDPVGGTCAEFSEENV